VLPQAESQKPDAAAPRFRTTAIILFPADTPEGIPKKRKMFAGFSSDENEIDVEGLAYSVAGSCSTSCFSGCWKQSTDIGEPDSGDDNGRPTEGIRQRRRKVIAYLKLACADLAP
jgi:hypothetical protein